MWGPLKTEVTAILATLFFMIAIFEYFQYLGAGITNSSVVQLEGQLIQITGFILAFTGVTYAAVFSQARFVGKPESKLPVRLGVGAIGSFMYLFGSLVFSSWTYVVSSNLDPTKLFPVSVAFVLPLGLIGCAFVLIMIAIWNLTVTLATESKHVGKASPSTVA